MGVILCCCFFCTACFCGRTYHAEVYVGGIVKDRKTKCPIEGIEVRMSGGKSSVLTTKDGKFGFREERTNIRQWLNFRDMRADRCYGAMDTSLYMNREKVVVEIFLDSLSAE